MKKRLDILVFERGLTRSRQEARAMIMAGGVYVDGIREDKPGTPFRDDAAITLKDGRPRYVGRGGLKLEKALHIWDINLCGKVCLDIGASTGGFTDCMLQNGAERVYSIDVGYGQLDWKLRCDPRVVCMERTNARYLEPSMFEQRPGFASVDVSFISLSKIIPAVLNVSNDAARLVCLIKPQFEAGRGNVGKNGVVRDIKTHISVLEDMVGVARGLGLAVLGLDFSPIKGPEGNIEFLIYLSKDGSNGTDIDIVKTAEAAHEKFLHSDKQDKGSGS